MVFRRPKCSSHFINILTIIVTPGPDFRTWDNSSPHPQTSTTNSLYGFNFASVVIRCSGSLIAWAISSR